MFAATQLAISHKNKKILEESNTIFREDTRMNIYPEQSATTKKIFNLYYCGILII